MPQPPASPSPAVLLTRHLAVCSLCALIALCLAWEAWLALPQQRLPWMALKALPLFIPLRGLLHYRMYTFRWLSLLVWPYFGEGVVRAWSDPAPSRWFAIAEIALSLLLFAACALHVRARFRNARQAAPDQR